MMEDSTQKRPVSSRASGLALPPQEPGQMDGEQTSLAEPQAWSELLTRGQRGMRVAANFFLGQGAIQGIGIVSGLLLARTLSLDAYAQFGLAIGFQSVTAILMDLGFASTIIPLVGENRDDRALVGRYVRSAKHLRDRSFLIIAPIATVAFLAVMHRHHWDWKIQAALTCSVLLALYSSGKMSYFSAPLFLYGKLRDYYMPQVFSGACRLVAYVVLSVVGGLNAWSAAGLSALNVTLNGMLLERKGRTCINWPEEESVSTDREIVRYVLPAAPASIFSAFQSQISLFLIGIFGGTVDIAQVAALGRIGALFSVLMTFNAVVVEPYFARLKPRQVMRNYVMVLFGAVVASVPVVLLAFWHPGTFLWLLGPKYADLRNNIGWLILASCINYLAGVMWIMNRARKWLFWSGSAMEIGLLLGTQIAFVAFVGVRTVHEAVEFTFVSSFCPLIAHAYVSVMGFSKSSTTNVVPETVS